MLKSNYKKDEYAQDKKIVLCYYVKLRTKFIAFEIA